MKRVDIVQISYAKITKLPDITVIHSNHCLEALTGEIVGDAPRGGFGEIPQL